MSQVVAGAEPFTAEGGRVGALVLHGLTGSPASMRPWAQFLADAGLTVRLPLLPGHGTRWQDLNRTRFADWYDAAAADLAALRATCDEVFVCGLSMGGALSLRLAEEQPAAVTGVVVVNASLSTADPRARLLPLLSRVVASMPPVGDDIKAPGVTEGAYPRLPLKAAASLQSSWAMVVRDLGKITAPVLAFRSVDDHVVPASSVQLLAAGARTVTVVELHDSYHVATVDNDAPRIFAESLAFIRAQSRIGA